jgi:EAL domain-containing protein (putative c-di-GMP-specific phosphodiesterase class I)
MNNAHQCLYRISRDGKDQISFFTEKVGNNDSQQFLLENEMRKDMEQKFRHFRVVYQPIVRVRPDGSEWIGAEALLRYSNPSFPELNQMEMIHTLEYSGLILPVGRWVIAQAVRECSKWNRNGNGNNSIVHVNISAQQVSDAGIVTYIKELCEEEGVLPSSLVIELTETSLLNNFEVAINFCKELLKLGVGVALDDFGTGYSSFNYLRDLPITEIKIDREFTRELQKSQYKQTFISFVYQLSKDLEVGLCVEGVETKEELELLEKMGIDTIQGFYFERPMEADVISREFPGRKTRE